MHRFVSVVLLSLSLALGACESAQLGETQAAVGTLGGAAAGGIVGSQVGKGGVRPATTELGILLGAWAGNEISTSMDSTDRIKNQQAESRAYAAPIGQQITWKNPHDGHSGTVVPVRDGYAPNGSYCRTFLQTVLIDGGQKNGSGTACQQQDGSWKIVP